MSPRDLAFIGCRLLALYLLASSLQAIVFNGWHLSLSFRSQQQWSQQDRLVEVAFLILPVIALLILVAILWRCAGWISDRATAKISEASSPEPGGWSRQGLLSVGVVAIGLWLLIERVPVLVQYSLLLLKNNAESEGPARVDVPHLAATLFATLLALLCVFGGQTVAGFIARVRRWSAESPQA